MVKSCRLFPLIFPLVVVLLISLSCTRLPGKSTSPWTVSNPGLAKTAIARAITDTPVAVTLQPTERLLPVETPTPDTPRQLPTLRNKPEEYIVQANDSLMQIARMYNISLNELIQANQLPNPDYLEVGQVLVIPPPVLGTPGPGFKIIPDSELVFSPGTIGFDTGGFISAMKGYLAGFQEDVEGTSMSGAQIIDRIARDYSVNPRLLLAVLEYRSGWVTQQKPAENTLEYPIVEVEAWRKGLYLQLAWTANQLNRGYYLWKVNGLGAFPMKNGELVPADPTLNAGTVAIQFLFGQLVDRAEWDRAVSESGLLQTYVQFFGNPYRYAIEPLVPAGISQPIFQLPFEPGRQWAFTGGPHGGWGDGSAWAALDFAPPGGALGCVQSEEWVTAVANGTVIRAGQGAVVQDLDLSGQKSNDGLEQTGWVVLYMHIENRDRVQPGDYLKAGDRIGHPSCEGGVSSGTHVHVARRYNGEWIPADQTMPLVMDGWVSRGSGREYDGYLVKDDQEIEAEEGYFPSNMIWR